MTSRCHSGVTQVRGVTAVLQADGLLVGYGGRPVLAGIDLELRANEVLCLIGHNGAGKSTLLKALFGLVPRQGGRILLDGVELAAPEPRALTARGMPVDQGHMFVLWASDDRSSMQVGRFMVDRSGSCRARFNLPASHTWTRFWVTEPGKPAVVATT